MEEFSQNFSPGGSAQEGGEEGGTACQARASVAARRVPPRGGLGIVIKATGWPG